MQNTIKIIQAMILITIVFGFLFAPLLVSADEPYTGLQNPLLGEGEDPTKTVITIQDIIRSVITVVLGMIGAASLVMFIYGGALWITSRGNAQQIEKGKNTVTWAIIGIITVFASFGVLQFIFETLGK